MNREVDLNFESKNKETHEGIICRFCFKYDFKFNRYKCLVCEDFDLCSHCFESNNKPILDHNESHLMIKISEPNKIDGLSIDSNTDITLDLIKELSKDKVHIDSTCSCCNISPIKQIRLKCDVCLEYEFCYECYLNKRIPKKTYSHNHSYNYHPMLVENKRSLEIREEQIKLLDEISSRSTSRTYIAKVEGSKKTFVCKKITLTNELGNEFQDLINPKEIFLNYLDELKNQNELISVNKINLHAYAFGDDFKSIYLLTEYMKNESLDKRLIYDNDDQNKIKNSLKIETQLKIAVDIAFGIYRFHQKHIVHKCIYPDNILIDSDFTAKINIYRFKSFLYEKNQKSENYPYIYINMPIEFFEKNFSTSPHVDIFSFGLTILDLFGGDHEIKFGKVKITREAKVFHQLVLKCLQTEKERPNAEEIYNYLKLFHSFVNYKINFLKYSTIRKAKSRKQAREISDVDITSFVINSINYFTDEEERQQVSLEDFINFMRVQVTEIIHRCFFCNSHKFKFYKYQCLVCKDFYLCNKCFENRLKNDNHKLCHPLIRYEQSDIEVSKKNLDSNLNIESCRILFKNKIHENSICIFCKRPIKGIRLKCDICYDFSLCYSCYSRRLDIRYESQISNNYPFKKEYKTHLYETHPLIIDYQSESKLEYDDVYISDRIIGRGGFGIVKRGFVKQTGLMLACKTILDKNSERSLLSFKRELDNYKEIKGENILRMIGNFIYDDCIYLLTELMEKGNLGDLLDKERSLSYETRLKIAVDIASGTSRIHEKGFIHKDIRPDNIFISSDYTAKIGDFGTAKLKEEKNTNGGHIGYMPKEFFPPIEQYNQKLDVFTMGLTFLEVFNGKHTKTMKTRITQQPFVFQRLINDCTAQVKDFNRPKSKRVYDYLNKCYQILRTKIDKNMSYYKTLNHDEEKNFFKETYDREFSNIRF